MVADRAALQVADDARTWRRVSELAARSFGCEMALKFGLRFSRKALNASLASAERTRTENSSFSSFTACSSWSRVDDLISRLQARNAAGGFFAKSRAV